MRHTCCSYVAATVCIARRQASRPSLCLWVLAQPSGSDVLPYEPLVLICNSISDQRFLLPFITVALVSHSFAIGKYPYKPATLFMREQIPKSLSFTWFCLCDLHPCTVEKAVITLARKIDIDGRSIALN